MYQPRTSVDSGKRTISLPNAILLGFCLLLSACAIPFRAQVSSTHNWPPAQLPQTLTLPYRFAPSTEDNLGLEQRVAAFLATQFWELQVGAQANQALLELAPHYTQTLREQRVMEPYYIPVSVPLRYPDGSMGTTTQMMYGGMRERVLREYDLRLQLDIYAINPTTHIRNPTTVWQGEAVTVSQRPNHPQALELLLKALFQDFPGPSGQTRTVIVKREN